MKDLESRGSRTLWLAKIALLLSGAWGCGSTSVVTHEAALANASEETGELRPIVPPSEVILAPGVSEIDIPCAAEATERCDAIDDDCDGIIDEGCGYRSGAIQLTVAWSSGADVNVYVTDPTGETVSFQRRQGTSGGHVDHAGRGQCTEAQANPRVENIYFGADAPRGEYSVTLHYLFECETGAEQTTATATLAVAEEIVGSYNYTLAPNERVDLMKFTIR